MPYSAIPLGRFAEDGSNLRFVCRDCGASVLAPIDQVVRRFGQFAPLGSLQAQAVCRACNSMEVMILPDTLAALSVSSF